MMLIGANIALIVLHIGVMNTKVILLAILIQQRIEVVFSASIATKTLALGVNIVRLVIMMVALLTMKVLANMYTITHTDLTLSSIAKKANQHACTLV